MTDSTPQTPRTQSTTKPESSPGRWRYIERQVRLISGLILACYLIPHLINHTLGLVSLQAMESYREVVSPFWQFPVFKWLLPGVLLTHLVFSLIAILRRATLRMPRSELIQLLLGLAVPLLLLGHIVGTRVTTTITGMETGYPYVMAAIAASDVRVVMQSALLVFVWVHLCTGLHMWLRQRGWYRRLRPLLFAIAVILPILALFGFWRGLSEVASIVATPGGRAEVFADWYALSKSDRSLILGLEPILIGVFSVVVALSLAVRWCVLWRGRAKAGATLRHSSGRSVALMPGVSMLEAMRIAGIDHASMCGGRARCTTCRVAVSVGFDSLPAPTSVEAQALARIGAGDRVRLACQTHPVSDVAITPLVDPQAVLNGTRSRRGGVEGSEQEVVALFVDLRGSTKLGEDKLPYDVVFILNRFFSEMSAALDDTGGLYAQFTGDGLLALYGLDSKLPKAARNALSGAANMLDRLDRLNRELQSELSQPLRVGIGIHAGEAIVGDMGPPATPIRSAIGDNINIAARLEALTKEYGVPLVVSKSTVEIAGYSPSGVRIENAPIRGRSAALEVYAIEDPFLLTVEAYAEAGVEA